MVNNMSNSAQQLNNNNNFAINYNYNRMNSSGQKAEEFLQPNSGSENKILSSMYFLFSSSESKFEQL